MLQTTPISEKPSDPNQPTINQHISHLREHMNDHGIKAKIVSLDETTIAMTLTKRGFKRGIRKVKGILQQYAKHHPSLTVHLVTKSFNYLKKDVIKKVADDSGILRHDQQCHAALVCVPEPFPVEI